MDSGDFGLEIWKDEDTTQAIAVLNGGVKVSLGNVENGFLSDLRLYPLVSTVQLTS